MSRRPRHARALSLGFTLLEVMVAIAILAISLTAIFSSQVGSMRTAARARRMNTASLLARCKMGEVEEQVLREGIPAVDDSGSDECCEGAEVPGYRCEWRIDRIVLPDDAGLSGDGASDDMTGAEGGPALAIGDFLGGGTDTNGLAQMAIGLAYPVLKPHIEEQVRRVSVEVFWDEGQREHSFDVVQYIVAEQPAATPGGSEESE